MQKIIVEGETSEEFIAFLQALPDNLSETQYQTEIDSYLINTKQELIFEKFRDGLGLAATIGTVAGAVGAYGAYTGKPALWAGGLATSLAANYAINRIGKRRDKKLIDSGGVSRMKDDLDRTQKLTGRDLGALAPEKVQNMAKKNMGVDYIHPKRLKNLMKEDVPGIAPNRPAKEGTGIAPASGTVAGVPAVKPKVAATGKAPGATNNNGLAAKAAKPTKPLNADVEHEEGISPLNEDIKEMIGAALNQEPIRFEEIFDRKMKEKISGYVEDLKSDLAYNLFDPEVNAEPEIESSEDETQVEEVQTPESFKVPGVTTDNDDTPDENIHEITNWLKNRRDRKAAAADVKKNIDDLNEPIEKGIEARSRWREAAGSDYKQYKNKANEDFEEYCSVMNGFTAVLNEDDVSSDEVLYEKFKEYIQDKMDDVAMAKHDSDHEMVNRNNAKWKSFPRHVMNVHSPRTTPSGHAVAAAHYALGLPGLAMGGGSAKLFAGMAAAHLAVGGIKKVANIIKHYRNNSKYAAKVSEKEKPGLSDYKSPALLHNYEMAKKHSLTKDAASNRSEIN